MAFCYEEEDRNLLIRIYDNQVKVVSSKGQIYSITEPPTGR